ncbi:hypothetical protein WJX75_005916 [Coccomyxa subellipsoidea]|uniref:RRM domain-containing protein n=1 Tax=Coccomyxa subellipsoidea TaxID=248742 RepID=A0ABR2YJH2_9CHLO
MNARQGKKHAPRTKFQEVAFLLPVLSNGVSAHYRQAKEWTHSMSDSNSSGSGEVFPAYMGMVASDAESATPSRSSSALSEEAEEQQEPLEALPEDVLVTNLSPFSAREQVAQAFRRICHVTFVRGAHSITLEASRGGNRVVYARVDSAAPHMAEIAGFIFQDATITWACMLLVVRRIMYGPERMDVTMLQRPLQ